MSDIRVLLIDDEEELVATLEERLGMRGIRAETATTVEQALELVRRSEFDVVVVDLKMPGLEGTEIVDRIRALRPRTGVLMITGHGSGHGDLEPLTHGGHRILLKPFPIERLVELIREVAQGGEAGR
jgi:two-component system OmpR family response regulator